jgi:hypothetical protein
MPTERYNAAGSEARWPKVWEKRGILATPNRDLGSKYCAPLPVRAHPCGEYPVPRP